MSSCFADDPKGCVHTVIICFLLINQGTFLFSGFDNAITVIFLANTFAEVA